MSAGLIFFAFASALALGGALWTVLSDSPIRSAMGLLTAIIGIAGLFVRLSAEFLATMQVMVYAGAVVVLFVFVVMLIGPNAHLKDLKSNRSLVSRVIAGVCGAGFGVAALALIAGGKQHRFPVILPGHGSVEAVGSRIYQEGLVPFELATALLLVGVLGALAVARNAPRKKTYRPEVANPTLRMFHGPLVDRDALEPLTGEPLHVRAARAADSSAPAADLSAEGDAS